MNVTDWIMIVITTIYGIATILICIFNYRSAKATREQVAESQRQFEETNRAFVTVTFEIIRRGLAVLHIQNHGKRIANNVRIRVANSFVSNIQDSGDKERVEKLNNSSFTLGIGQSWYICIGSHLQLEQMGKEILYINILYSDNKSDYSEQANIDLTQFFWSLIYDSPLDDICQQIKESNKHLKSIATTLKKDDIATMNPLNVVVHSASEQDSKKLKLLKFVSIDIHPTLKTIAEQADLSLEETYNLLVELMCVDHLVGTYISEDWTEMREDMVWFKK